MFRRGEFRFSGRLWMLAALTVGIAFGMGLFTFVYARGYSYLGHDSAVCNNCHAMNAQYAGWLKGSHRTAAQCADCHTPFNPAGKYAIKAWDGFWHSYYFTTNTYPDHIQITDLSLRVAEGQCRACHQAVTEQITHGSGETSCIRCHATVGHQ